MKMLICGNEIDTDASEFYWSQKQAPEKERLIQACKNLDKDGVGFPDDMKIKLNAGGN